MADAIRPTMNVDKFRETQTSQAATHRGDAGRKGAAVARPDGEDKKPRQDEGPATVVSFEELSEGRNQVKLSDGRSILKAANNMLREDDPDGTMRLSLPNGILVQRDADGKTAGFDPATGKAFDVKVDQQSENGQYYFEFKDGSGNKYLATSETLRFEVTNPSGTVHQKVSSTGSIGISTTTVLRDEAGRMRQETETITARPDGEIIGMGKRHKNVVLTNDTLKYTQSTGVRVEADLPYPIPFELKAEKAAPQAAPLTPPTAPSTLMQAEPEAPITAAVPPAEDPLTYASQAPQGPVPIAPNAYGPQPGTYAAAQPGPVPPNFGQAGQMPGGMPGQMPGGMPGQMPGGMPGQMPGGMPGQMPYGGMPGGMPGANAFVAPNPGMPYPGGMPGMGMPGMGMPGMGMPGMGMPGMGMPGMGMPGMGMPNPFPTGVPDYPYGGGNPNAQPWAMPPFGTGGPSPQVNIPSDPYAPISTASGMVRRAQPDGSMFISLPNGVVLAQQADGQYFAYDARINQPLPATAQDVVTPNGGSEKQVVFRDATGNEYMMYSKSLDFAVTSADGRMRQIVMPQGNILVMAQTPTTDPQGKPGVQQHMVEVLPDGQINTFGNPQVQLGLDKVTFGTQNGPVTMPLAYPVPQYQGMLSTIQQTAQLPTSVSGTMYTPATQPAPQPAPPPMPPSAQPSPSGPSQSRPASFWGPEGPVWSDGPSKPAAQPQAAQPQAAPPQPSGPPVPPEVDAAVNQIMTQALGENPVPEKAAELRPLLVKILTNTATPDEVQRATDIVDAATAPQPAASQQTAAQTAEPQAQASPPQPQAPAPQTAAAPPAQPQSTAPAQSEEEAQAAAIANAKTQIKAGVSQLIGPKGDPKVGAELEDLYFKAVTGTANEDELKRIQTLEHVALEGNPELKAQMEAQAAQQQAQPAAAEPQAAQPTPTPQATADPQAAKPTGEPAAAAQPTADLPMLDDKQVAAVQQAMTQVAAAGADEKTLTELQPLLIKIVAQKATPDELQRADAIVQQALANAPQAAAQQAAPAPPANPADRPPIYGVPHIANAQELWAAANGQPQYASADNAPAEYHQWAEQVMQQAAEARAQQAAQQPPAPPAAAPAAAQAAAPATATAAPASAPRDQAPVVAASAPGSAGAAPPNMGAAPLGAAPPNMGAVPPNMGAVPPNAGSTPPPPPGVGVPPIPGAPPNNGSGFASAVNGPHKPGMWQRIKGFFNGSSTGAPRYTSWNPYQSWNPYPCHTYNANPYAPYQAMQGMMAAQMLTTTLTSMMFMPSMYCWNPIGFMGGFGAFPPMMW